MKITSFNIKRQYKHLPEKEEKNTLAFCLQSDTGEIKCIHSKKLSIKDGKQREVI